MIEGLIRVVDAGEAASDYDILFDFTGVDDLDVGPCDLVRLAMARRATLPDATERAVRSAAIATNPETQEFVDMWSTFFEERDRAIDARRFETAEAAVEWLERTDALNTILDTLRNPEAFTGQNAAAGFAPSSPLLYRGHGR